MSNEYDYNQDRSEDNTGYNTADSTQRQQGGTYPQEDHTGGTYHYSGASIPGGGYEHDDYGSMVVPVSPRKVIPTLRPILWPPIMYPNS